MHSTRLPAALAQARASGRVLLDLAESDPARCGLGWDAAELDALRGRGRDQTQDAAVSAAREAIAGYLAGHNASVAPDRIVPVRSRSAALRRALELLCEGGGEALVPVPHRALLEPSSPVLLQQYGLVFEGRWRLDRRSIQRAVSSLTRAIVVGNPADPTGAQISPEELGFLEHLCQGRQIALLADESFLDASLEPAPSAASVTRCLAIHASGLGGVCGAPQLEGEWLAVAGPEALARSWASRLASLADVRASGASPGVQLAPPLLGRRQAFLSRLRARLARNRSAVASASVREAPWTLQWGGGWWAVLEINLDQDEDKLCLALLEEGVAVLPGYVGGLPPEGYLILSVLPTPEVFDAALRRLEALLRRPVSPSARA